ncbi:MAG: hypothetical protein V1724_08620 [Chloroflexota bacterium]
MPGPCAFRCGCSLPAALVTTAVVLFVLATASELPSQKVATHFALDGTPNDWMISRSYILMMVGISLGMFGVLAGLFFGTTHAAIPGADQWAVSGEAVIEAVIGMFTWVQVLLAVVALDTYWFNVRGEHVIPVGVSMAALLASAAVLTLAVILFVVLRGRRRQAFETPDGKERTN